MTKARPIKRRADEREAAKQALIVPETPKNGNAEVYAKEQSIASHILKLLREQNQKTLELTKKAKQTLAETVQQGHLISSVTTDIKMAQDAKTSFDQVLGQLRQVADQLKNADKLVQNAQETLEQRGPSLKK